MEKEHPLLGYEIIANLQGVARSKATYRAVPVPPEDSRINRLLDEIYLVAHCLDSRCPVITLERERRVIILRKISAT